jgi:hypothetical protein
VTSRPARRASRVAQGERHAVKRMVAWQRQWHRFLVHIPPEPPRRLRLSIWLAWLVHSYRMRLTFYLSLMPAFLLVVAPDALWQAIRHPGSLKHVIVNAMMLAPIVVWVGAMREVMSFARLVSRGTRVVTHTHAVRAETGRASGFSGGVRVWSFPVTDVAFEYQGARDGVNIQGVWRGRIRFLGEPAEGQPMPVFFDPARPDRHLVLWAYGLTTSVGDPAPGGHASGR